MSTTSSVLQGLFPNLPAEVIGDVCNSGDGQFESLLRHCLLLDADHYLNAIEAHAHDAASDPLLIVLRGLPGSGKSTLGKAIKTACRDGDVAVVSADDFFLDPKGNYVYIPHLISKAHEWARAKAKKAMKQRKRVVISDNTNTQSWEMLPYFKLSAENGYTVLVLEPDTEWSHDPSKLAAMTSHGVPKDKIELMKSRYEYGLTAESVCHEGLPPPIPRTTTLEALVAMRPETETAASDSFFPSPSSASASPKTNQDKTNEDFQSLLNCFPHLSVHQIYPLYLQANGSLEEAVSLVLEQTQQEAASPSHSTFSVTLDAQFAAQMEDAFGNARKGENFPGLLQANIPASLARAIHHHWSTEVREKLSTAAVQRFQKDLENIGHGQYSSRASKAALSPLGSNPGLEDAFYETQNYEGFGDDEGWTEFRPVPANVQWSEIKAMRDRRVELYQKAAAAFKKKSGGVAGYYSEEGRKLTDKIHGMEVDFRFQLFMDSKPLGSTKLDLHGLTTTEALERVEWWLEAKRKELRQEPTKQVTKRLEVVTGRGLGSRGKQGPRIKPAVENFLRESGISFAEGQNEGCIEVVIKK